jgi:hypothetical protein
MSSALNPLSRPQLSPLIVRIAGLPGTTLAPFSSPRILELLEAERAHRADAASARASFVETLAEALPRFPAETRRFLLAVKRDAFNGRELSRHAAHPAWATLDRLSRGLAEELLALEAAGQRLDAELCRCVEEEHDRERRHLFEHLADTRFVRGIALSSPELVERALELSRRPGGRFDRRARKVEQSLLRFVTRAAAKLSPSSTLTAFALGAVSEDTNPERLAPVAASLSEVSLVRVSGPLLIAYLVLLQHRPEVRARCLLALNDTAEEIEPRRYRLLRPGSWQLDEEHREIQYRPGAQVRVTLNGDLIGPLCRLLAAGPVLYADVVRELAIAGAMRDEGGEVHSRIARLLSVGFLMLLPPMPTHEPRFEESLLALLRSLAADQTPDQALGEVTRALERLLDLERCYASVARPERAARSIMAAVHELGAAVHRAIGSVPSEAEQHAPLLHEDVLLMPAEAGPERPEALLISSRQSTAILDHAELLSKFTSLYNHRHDLLHTLAAFWSTRWPTRQEIPLLDLFWAVQPLWREYLRFDARHRFRTFSSFNPLCVPAIDDLNRLREQVFCEAQAAMQEVASGYTLSPESLKALVDYIPPRYRPLLGCSVFVQPATPDGRLWVLNRLFEGTGRYLSRYGSVLDKPARSRFHDHFRLRSTVQIDREEVELLDLMFTSPGTTNSHAQQTPRVLQVPGEHVRSSAGSRVLLRDLRVRADLSRDAFHVIDSTGRRLLPVHLNSLSNLLLPDILRFLSMFGPFEVRQIFPRPQRAGLGGSERLTCGPLVVQRKRWELDVSSIAAGDAHEPEHEAFRRLHAWRQSAGLPVQLFVYEPIHEKDDLVHCFKPQYLDFSSPSLLGVFLSILRKAPGHLILEEALPLFTDFPHDGTGASRAVEVQIDTMALRPPRPEIAPDVLAAPRPERFQPYGRRTEARPLGSAALRIPVTLSASGRRLRPRTGKSDAAQTRGPGG